MPIGASHRAIMAAANSGEWHPSALFGSGEDGAIFDPSDSSTVFQETTGLSATTAAGNGDPVGTILDLSGNGNFLTSPADNRRPTLTQSGGLWFLDFYVGGTVIGVMRRGAAGAVLGNTWTHCGAWKSDVATGQLAAFSGGDTSLGAVFCLPDFDQWRFTTSHTFVDAGSSGELQAAHVLTVEYDHNTTTVAGRYNGGAVSSSNSNTNDFTALSQGLALSTRENDADSQYFQGRMYVGVWIDRAVTTGERALLEAWVAAKAGVSI